MRKILGLLSGATLFPGLFSCSPATYKKINCLQDVRDESMFGNEGE